MFRLCSRSVHGVGNFPLCVCGLFCVAICYIWLHSVLCRCLLHCIYLTNTHDMHYIYVMIEPLTYTTDHTGKQTKWRDSIPQLYTDLRAQGYTHSDIVTGWGISDNTLALWTARSPALAHAIDNAPSTPATHNPKPEPYSQESLRRMANQALHDLLARMILSPNEYKPNEIITAAREALDRTDGKPLQSSHVTGNTAIHIIGHVLPPASQLKVIDNVIEGG